MNPILHTKTKRLLEAYLKKPMHGLVLSGEEGVGKYFVALWLAKQRELSSYTLESEEGKSTITIEQVRNLYNLTRTGNGLMILIKDAHQMGREAQNAFLKLLEEPPKNTSFILTTSSIDSLLSTIRSRTQAIEVHTPSKNEVLDYARNLTQDNTSISPLITTAKALPGLITEVLKDDESLQQHTNAVAEAKQFYAAGAYQRHMLCLSHSYEKAWIQQLLDLLTIILGSLLKANSARPEVLKKLSHQAELIEQTALRTLVINGNPKIHLARLCEEL